MKILICDDEAFYLDSLVCRVKEYMKNHYIDCQLISTTNPKEILCSDIRFDLAFLDIQMNEVDGISLAKVLKERNSKLVLFFVTNYNEYQDDAMDLRAFRYFEKPFNVERLYSGLDKAMEYINGSYVDVFMSDGKLQKHVLVDDIMYVMIDNRQVVITTVNSQFTVKEKFEDCCAMLPTLFFYRVHRAFLVNLHYVKQYSYSELFLTDGTRIPVAPRKQADFHSFWFEYLRRR